MDRRYYDRHSNAMIPFQFLFWLFFIFSIVYLNRTLYYYHYRFGFLGFWENDQLWESDQISDADSTLKTPELGSGERSSTHPWSLAIVHNAPPGHNLDYFRELGVVANARFDSADPRGRSHSHP